MVKSKWRTDVVNIPRNGSRFVVPMDEVEVYYSDELCAWIVPSFKLSEAPKKFRFKR